MLRIEDHLMNLADPVLGSTLAGDQVLGVDAASIAECEWRRAHRLLDRAPDVDDGEAPLEQGLRFLGRQEVAHSLRAGAIGIVVVDVADRLADVFLVARRLGTGATGMIENHHP